MALNYSKLEKLVDLGNGIKRARCPACAAAGQDRTGEHLRIYADGKFGCCVHPKDREHRKQIFALIGERSKPATVRVRVAAANNSAPVDRSIFSRISPIFASQTATDVSDGQGEVQSMLFTTRTARTGESEFKMENLGTQQTDSEDSRTSRTGTLYSSICTEKNTCTYIKGFDKGVRSVRESEGGKSALDLQNGVRDVRTDHLAQKLPYFTPDGTLVIPFDSPERYHWWKGGQSVAQTRQEILERN